MQQVTAGVIPVATVGYCDFLLYAIFDVSVSLRRLTGPSLYFDVFMASRNIGMATAARMPMIATTIISSISVKPFWAIFFMFISLFVVVSLLSNGRAAAKCASSEA